MKKSLPMALSLAAILAAALLAAPGCKKKQPPPSAQDIPAHSDVFQGKAASEKKVVLPDEVRNAWKAVRIEVLYKERKEKRRFDVPLNAGFEVPGTGLTLKTGAFLPHFSMAPDRITSESNRPENPAVQLSISEDDREIFDGWLFAKYPDVHPFAHDRYAVALVEGIGK
jgi:hypothetical protein